MPDQPILTVVLLTPDDFSTISLTVSHVATQTNAGGIELLIVTPEPELLHIDSDATDRFHSVKVIKSRLDSGSGGARATAVHEASAEIVVFAEDHCFPEEGWAEAIVGAYRGPWAAVGPVVRNANPTTMVSWADLLMGYGPWLAPGESAERDHLPGHNSSYRKSVLLPLGDELAGLIEAETALQWRLRADGHRLYQESGARVAHTNFERWGTWLHVSFHAGRVFAATRVLDWPVYKRVAFALGTPLVPAVRLVRHLRQSSAAGLSRRLVATVIPTLIVGLIVDAAGQCAGCLAGAGRSRATLVEWDFHRNVARVRSGALSVQRH